MRRGLGAVVLAIAIVALLAVDPDPRGPLARAFREVALRAVGELAARTKDYSRLFPKITVEED